MCKKNCCKDEDEIIRERLEELYHDLHDPFMPIFDAKDEERENRKVRKLQEAVRKVHNWFATYDQRIEK